MDATSLALFRRVIASAQKPPVFNDVVAAVGIVRVHAPGKGEAAFARLKASLPLARYRRVSEVEPEHFTAFLEFLVEAVEPSELVS